MTLRFVGCMNRNRYKGKKRKGYDAGFDDGFVGSGCDSEEK